MRAILIVILLFAAHACAKHTQQAKPAAGGDKADEVMPSTCPHITKPITYGQHAANLASLATCKYSRNATEPIFMEFFDFDDTGLLSIEACNILRNSYVPKALRGVVESCQVVFDHCDCDGDGLIDRTDVIKAVDYCLNTCPKVLDFWKYVGSHMGPDVELAARNPAYHE